MTIRLANFFHCGGDPGGDEDVGPFKDGISLFERLGSAEGFAGSLAGFESTAIQRGHWLRVVRLLAAAEVSLPSTLDELQRSGCAACGAL